MSPGRRILVVDDEEGLRVSLVANLELEGYEVLDAPSGARAIELVREQRFDLVLTDVRMPGIDGIDTFRAIQRLSPGTRVVLMTAFSREIVIDQALDEGVYTAIFKPFAVDRVLQLVARAVRRPVVLVVDDAAEQAASMVRAFREVGLDAEAVHDGAAAVRLVSEGAVDVCVLDLVMPGMDGIATCEEIRRADPSVAVIAVSGHSVPEMMHRIMSLGGYACLRKPFEMRQLLRTAARARGGSTHERVA